MFKRQECLPDILQRQKDFYQVGKEGRLCLDNKLADGYAILRGDTVTSGLADSRRGLAQNEGIYYCYNQGKSVTQFSLNFLS